MIEYKDHNFIRKYKNAYICNRCNIKVFRFIKVYNKLCYDIFYLSHSEHDKFIPSKTDMAFEDKFELSCNEILIKNIIE